MVKAGMALSQDQSLGMKFSYHENDANISYRGLLLEDYRAGADYNPAPDDYFLTDRIGLDLNHEWRLSERATLKTLAYWSEVTRDYWRYNVDTAASNDAGRWIYTDSLTGNNRSFERYGIETRLALQHQLFGIASDAEFGLRFMQEESDDTRIRASRAADRTGVNDRHIVDSADSIAAYVQNRMQLTDRLALTPGLRVESYEQERILLTDNNALADTSNTEALPGIGATYELTDTAQLYGGVYRAFSPASNGVALDGLTDQDLEGERSVNYEIGVRGLQGALSYEVAAFFMDFDNQVVTGNSDPNLSQSNAGKTLHQGMELVLGYELGAGFSLDTNFTWVPDSEFRSGENRGNRLPYSPEYLANASLNYSDGKLSAALTAHHRGEQYGDPGNQKAIPAGAASGIWGGLMPSYTLYDAMAQYTVSDQLTLFGAVKNIADKRYITGLRQGIYVGPERSLELGLRYRL
jgi:Fe(3+) dicitrate transport protein